MPTILPKVEELETPPQKPEEGIFQPSQKEIDVVSRIFRLFVQSRDQRNATFEYLDNKNIIDYIDDSVRRFTTNVDTRVDIEDWQARIHAPFTRNKVLAILGKIVDVLPMVEVLPRGSEDILRAEIINTLFEYSEDVDNVEEFLTYAIEEALVKGTVVGYEGIEVKDKEVREIKKSGDGDNISFINKKIRSRKLRSYIVPLEEFYPSSIGIREISKMPYCFWRKVVDYSKFLQDYSGYEKAEDVEPFQSFFGQDEQKPFYWDYISNDINDGQVEIIRYYNQETDEFVIISNGVWLNPVQGEEVSPIPFNHKRLPFWSFIYDIFGSDFFYGKSLPDRIKKLQDVLNTLHNMLLDQSFLTIFPPILVAGVDDIEDDFLRPGRRITVDTQGLPIQQAYQRLDLGTPSGWHQFILQYTKDILEESTVDQVTQGIAGVGERTTATEIRSAAAGVVSLLGLFARFIRFGLKERARLRIANILQFYTDPHNPIIEQVLGVGGTKKASKIFNVFEVESSPLTPGSRGTKIIEMFTSKQELPTKKELRLRTALDEKTAGKKITRIAVTPEYLRNYEFDVRLVLNPKSESSKDLDRALEIQFQQTMLSLYGDIVDRKEMAAELISKFGKDPAKILKEEIIAPQLQPEQEQANQLVPQQGGDNFANTVRGGTGVGNEGLATRDLINQLRG